MHPFAVGDIVECIDDTPLPGRQPGRCEVWIKLGHWYRVSSATCNFVGEYGVSLEGVPQRWNCAGWHAWRFRRVDPAEADFIQMLRALAPSQNEPVCLAVPPSFDWVRC